MKTDEDIDIGSTVQLRSGSPKMTVRALLKRDGNVVGDEEPDELIEQAECVWFGGESVLKSSVFPIGSLRIHVPYEERKKDEEERPARKREPEIVRKVVG
jgi:uncharacterized protein YodC (DUF2158 family)